MALRLQTLRVPATAPTRVTVPRTNFANVPLRASRPAQLQSEFISPVATLKGLCASFSQMVMEPFRQAISGSRQQLMVECNNKKGLGVTLRGTRRKRAKVSGFRSRMQTVGGRKVLAARRKKGRKVLCPAGVPKRK